MGGGGLEAVWQPPRCIPAPSTQHGNVGHTLDVRLSNYDNTVLQNANSTDIRFYCMVSWYLLHSCGDGRTFFTSSSTSTSALVVCCGTG